MRFLYIVLVAIGLFGCGVEEDTPIAPAPVVNVAPPDVTIQPTEVGSTTGYNHSSNRGERFNHRI